MQTLHTLYTQNIRLKYPSHTPQKPAQQNVVSHTNLGINHVEAVNLHSIVPSQLGVLDLQSLAGVNVPVTLQTADG